MSNRQRRGGFEDVAAAEAATRQDSEEGYWFGDGPMAGVVPTSEMRMIAVSTRIPDEEDLLCFGPKPANHRSVYQKFTVPRDCTIGLIEMHLKQPDTQAYSRTWEWAQITVYDDSGAAGTPGAVLGRCVPIPLPSLYDDNFQVYLAPLWVPAAVSALDVIWIGISPKAYTGPAEAPPSDDENTRAYVLSRGNRDVTVFDLIKAEGAEGYSKGAVAPATDMTLSGDVNMMIAAQCAPPGLMVTFNWAGCNTGPLIAAEMEAKIQALGGAYSIVTVTYIPDAGISDYYLVTTGKKQVGSSVIITDAGANNCADDLKLGVANGGTEEMGLDGQVEPPLLARAYTLHNDRHFYIRLYEPPQGVELSSRSLGGAPLSPIGSRSVISRPVRGDISSAFTSGIRPGHGTQPWSTPAGYYYGAGSGGGILEHNALKNIQGGGFGQRYHLTTAEYAGTWAHHLIAISALECPIEGHRTTAQTATVLGGVLAKAISSGNMADGFGPGYLYAIEDEAGVENVIAGAYAARAGADNTGALLWKTATGGVLTERMRLTATGLGIGCTPAYPLDLAGTARVGTGVGEGGDALILNIERSWAFRQLSTGAGTGLQLICLAGNKAFYIDTDSGTVFRSYAGVNAASLAHLTGVWWWLPTATALTLNGHLAQSSTFNTLVGRIGDTTTRFGGTVSNVASALGEFLSQTNLVHTMWSDTVDKDFWVTGKPINVFAICRYRLPAGDAGGDYTCTVEVLLGTEVLVERTIRHTLGAPVLSGYYYVELHSRVTKYTNNNLRLVSRAKQSAVVALASWVEGAKLTLTEYAEVRADPVVEDVTSANVTLQVRVTFSRSATGLRCVLMDAGWEAAG